MRPQRTCIDPLEVPLKKITCTTYATSYREVQCQTLLEFLEVPCIFVPNMESCINKSMPNCQIYLITNYLLGVCCILSRESASGRFAICRRSRRSTSNSGDLAAACHDLGALVFARLGCVCVCDLLILTVDHVDVYFKKELVKISKMFGTKHITPNDPPSSLLNVSLCKGQAFNCRTARSFQAPRGR